MSEGKLRERATKHVTDSPFIEQANVENFARAELLSLAEWCEEQARKARELMLEHEAIIWFAAAAEARRRAS